MDIQTAFLKKILLSYNLIKIPRAYKLWGIVFKKAIHVEAKAQLDIVIIQFQYVNVFSEVVISILQYMYCYMFMSC